MSELEIQQEFRETVVRDLENERAMLSELAERVSKLEQTVVHGNGHPALTVQVKELEVKVDNLSRDVSMLRGEMSKMDAINNLLVSIQTRLEYAKENKSLWAGFISVIATVVLTALAQWLFGK